jgi:hypothetical protein
VRPIANGTHEPELVVEHEHFYQEEDHVAVNEPRRSPPRKPSIHIVQDVEEHGYNEDGEERGEEESPMTNQARRVSSPRPHVKFSEEVFEIERDPELDALDDQQDDLFGTGDEFTPRGEDEEEDEDEKALRIARNSPKPDLSDAELELLAQEVERRASAAGLEIPPSLRHRDEEEEEAVEDQIASSSVPGSLSAMPELIPVVVEEFSTKITQYDVEQEASPSAPAVEEDFRKEDDYLVEEPVESPVILPTTLAALTDELTPVVEEDFCKVTVSRDVAPDAREQKDKKDVLDEMTDLLLRAEEEARARPVPAPRKKPSFEVEDGGRDGEGKSCSGIPSLVCNEKGKRC